MSTGSQRTVVLKLDRTGRALLARFHRLPATVRLASSGPSRRATFRAKKPHRRHGHRDRRHG